MAAVWLSWRGAGPGVSGPRANLRWARADSRHKRRPSCAEDGVEMLADDTVEHAVLGVSRAITQLGSRHTEEYRPRRNLPMPKHG